MIKLKKLIVDEFIYAQTKHPVFDQGKGEFFAMSILSEEVGEVAQALNDGNKEHAKKELAQVLVVAWRFLGYLNDRENKNET